MDYRNKTIILFLLGMIFSCQNEDCENCDFYSKPPPYSDVSRLPIIEPFELITAYCCSDWHISETSKNFNIFKLNVDVDSIGYNKDTIYIFDSDKKYFVLNLIDSSKIEYQSFTDFSQFHHVRLYSVEAAFKYYEKYKLPPWVKK